MLSVCLPSEQAVKLTGPLPDGVRVLVWDGSGEPAPAGIEETEFLVFDHGAPFAEVISAMPRLRVVQATSAGIDRLLGKIPEGVTLCDGRGVHGASASEWVLAAILASVRQLPGFVRDQQRGEWLPRETDELSGQTVLIVGAGDIGTQIARRVRAFDAEPVLVARRARAASADGPVHAREDLPGLLPGADTVVTVVPMTTETRHMVDADFLGGMRDGALLVNAARGPVVVTDALLAELESGRLRAALDVTDPEPLPPDHPLWHAPNLLITPHVAGMVRGLPQRAYALVRGQIQRYVNGEPLINVVDGDY